MLLQTRGFKLMDPPNIFLDGTQLSFVDSFKYLGHIITKDFRDDDVKRATRSHKR